MGIVVAQPPATRCPALEQGRWSTTRLTTPPHPTHAQLGLQSRGRPTEMSLGHPSLHEVYAKDTPRRPMRSFPTMQTASLLSERPSRKTTIVSAMRRQVSEAALLGQSSWVDRAGTNSMLPHTCDGLLQCRCPTPSSPSTQTIALASCVFADNDNAFACPALMQGRLPCADAKVRLWTTMPAWLPLRYA